MTSVPTRAQCLIYFEDRLDGKLPSRKQVVACCSRAC
jgi:hypothetical protein